MEKEQDFKKPEYYENRELSWLKFNHRVLNEARDKSIPLLERLKFVCYGPFGIDTGICSECYRNHKIERITNRTNEVE